MYQLSKVFAHGSFLTLVYPDGTEKHILKRWWPHTRQHDKAPKIWLKVGTTYERNSREHERQVYRIVGNHSYGTQSCVSAYQRRKDEGVVDSGMSCTGGRIITKEVTI